MPNKIERKLAPFKGIFVTATLVTGLVIAGNLMGIFQFLEWKSFDKFIEFRPQEIKDSQVVIVTIDEEDINTFGHPFSDILLADLLNKIKAQNPTVIGLDIYRNIPVKDGENGYEELRQVFQSTPNLIGVEKATPPTVAPPPILAELNQVGLADLILDDDGKIRRGFISLQPDENKPVVKSGLSVMVALKYLESHNITLQTVENNPYEYDLGKIKLTPFIKNDGGYVNADTRGYQILINFRGNIDTFESVSMRDVINNKISPELFKDKIIFVGAIAPSLNDDYQTPISHQMPGVVIHANIASQLVNGALEGRNFIKVWHDLIEYFWILIWAFVGAIISWKILAYYSFKSSVFYSVLRIILSIFILDSTIIFLGYGAFVLGWWIPVATPLFSLTGSALAIAIYKTQDLHRLASLDGLTQVVNRRYFDEQLYNAWYKKIGDNEYLSVILCDVDFFKPYNDTYGHQAGDRCLQKVAQAMTQAVRSNDLVARYGGEEFVVILPNTDGKTAVKVAQNICNQIQKLEIPHSKSKVSEYVTLSCGVACMIPHEYSSPVSLIEDADKALYQAKEKGRNQVVILS
jgi:adenylate cyclase